MEIVVAVIILALSIGGAIYWLTAGREQAEIGERLDRYC